MRIFVNSAAKNCSTLRSLEVRLSMKIDWNIELEIAGMIAKLNAWKRITANDLHSRLEQELVFCTQLTATRSSHLELQLG